MVLTWIAWSYEPIALSLGTTDAVDRVRQVSSSTVGSRINKLLPAVRKQTRLDAGDWPGICLNQHMRATRFRLRLKPRYVQIDWVPGAPRQFHFINNLQVFLNSLDS